MPAEIGCEVGLQEGERVAHLIYQHLGPSSWMWGGARGRSTMVGVMRKGRMCDGWCIDTMRDVACTDRHAMELYVSGQILPRGRPRE
jgi:hypothetical protein